MGAHLDHSGITSFLDIDCSSSVAVVVLEHSLELFSARDGSGNGTETSFRLDQLIAESPMIPFDMVMFDILTHGIIE